MDSNEESTSYHFDDENIKRIKELYSEKMKDKPDNPMKVCMKLVLDSAIEKDPQKKIQLSYQFSEFLTKPGGVMRLFLAMVDFDTSSQKNSTHNQRFLAITNMILGLPNICMPFDDYCINIANQIKSLLYSDNIAHSNLGSIIIKFMLESSRANKDKMPDLILGPIFEPILYPNATFMTTDQAIKSIHNLILNHLPIKHFVDIFHDLFFLVITLKDTPSDLKRMIYTVLIEVVNGLKPGASCCLIETTLLQNNNKLQYEFVLSINDDGVSFKLAENQVNYVASTPFETIMDVLYIILQKCDNQSLILEFFFYFKDTMWMSRNEEFSRKCAALIEPLLDETIGEETSNKLNLFDIIANNQSRTLELLTRTLSGYLNFLRYERDDREKTVLTSIKGCLDILDVISYTLFEPDDQSYLKNKCLPVLIQTKDAISSNDKEGKKDNYREEKTQIIDQITNISKRCDANNSQENFIDKTDFDSASKREYCATMKDLNDKLVPVRVHALVKLKQMLIANDKYTLSRTSEIQSMIEGLLADSEPYVFLACINLMAEMSIRKTKETLPKLIDLYSCQELDLQHRINVGEILVKLAKQMNETAPFYCGQIMNMLFQGFKDPDELIRMSSLVNMGEICRNLGDSLWKYIVEILTSLESIIEFDTVQVKCAAIDLLRSTLSGLDSLKVESIQCDIKRLYDLLKKVKLRTLDDKLCLQVELAMDEIDRIARQLLGFDVLEKREKNGGENLVKKINMLQLNN